MSSRKLFEIALKVLGVLCFVWGIQVAGSLLVLVKQVDQTWIERSLPLTLSLLFFALAAILLLKTESLARKLVPESSELQLVVGDTQSVYTLALRILGAVLLVSAIPRIVAFVFSILAYRTGFEYYLPRQLEGAVSVIVELLIALYLLFGAKRFVAFVMKGSMREG